MHNTHPIIAYRFDSNGQRRLLCVYERWTTIRSSPVKVVVDGLYCIAAPFNKRDDNDAAGSTAADDLGRALHRSAIDAAEAARQSKKAAVTVAATEDKKSSSSS